MITDFCDKGSLKDILENVDINLDDMFVSSLINDLINGMIFLHNSDIVAHGNLRSSNCVVTSRWTLQIADFGLYDLRNSATQQPAVTDRDFGYDNEDFCSPNKTVHDPYGEDNDDDKKLWWAPELLRSNEKDLYKGTQKGDVYSFGIIMYEVRPAIFLFNAFFAIIPPAVGTKYGYLQIFGRNGPYGEVRTLYGNTYILERVRVPEENYPQGKLMRPDIKVLEEVDRVTYKCDDFAKRKLIVLMCYLYIENMKTISSSAKPFQM